MDADQNMVISAPGSDQFRMRTMKKEGVSERSLLVVSIALAIAQVWINRYAVNGDAISYLDVGDTYFRGDWAAAINGYWSPLYSWCLGLALYVLKPSIWWEFITVHLVNLIIFIGVLFSFRFFLHSVLRAIRRESEPSDDSVPLPEWIVLGLGYGIFLWGSLVLIDTGMVAPDLLVAGFLLLMGGYLVDLRYEETYGKFAMFGVLNGVAYLGKAIMFPLGFGLLTILLFSGRNVEAESVRCFIGCVLIPDSLSAFCRSAVEEQGKIDVWRQWKDQLCGGSESERAAETLARGDGGRRSSETPDSTTAGASRGF